MGTGTQFHIGRIDSRISREKGTETIGEERRKKGAQIGECRVMMCDSRSEMKFKTIVVFVLR